MSRKLLASLMLSSCTSLWPSSAPTVACPPTPDGVTVDVPEVPVEGAVLGFDVGAGGREPPWRLLEAKGAEFVYLKASKSTVVEPTFQTWWAHAKACGLKRGAVHWICPARRTDGVDETCPTSDVTDAQIADPVAFGTAQGAALVRALGDDPGELPPALDVEPGAGDYALRPEDHARTLAIVQAAAAEIRKASGRTPIVYGGTRSFESLACPGASCCAGAPFDTEVFWEASYGAEAPRLSSCWSGRAWSLWQFAPGDDWASAPAFHPDWDVVEAKVYRAMVQGGR